MKSHLSCSPLRVTLLLLSLGFGAPALASDYSLNYEEWARPRSAEVVMRMPVVSQVMRDWLRATPGSRLEIRYPGGAEGNLWASELRDWLVALGVPSDQVERVSGSPRGDQLELAILSPRP